MTRKTIVITGCSSGFGRCTALALARRGWHVFATVRQEADRESLLTEARSQQCQENLTPLLCDIVQNDQIQALVCQVEELLREETGTDTPASPRLNALLNNAGTAYGGPIELLALDDLREQFEINVIAHVAVTQAFLPMLKAARGTIINVSSVSGQISTPVTGAYAASKFALEAISDALRLELAPFGVHVVLIEPASSPTSIWQTSLERSRQRLGERWENNPYVSLLNSAEKMATRSSTSGFPPQRFADTVVKILANPRPRARYGVPHLATVVMLLHRFLPGGIWDRLLRLAVRW